MGKSPINFMDNMLNIIARLNTVVQLYVLSMLKEIEEIIVHVNMKCIMSKQQQKQLNIAMLPEETDILFQKFNIWIYFDIVNLNL